MLVMLHPRAAPAAPAPTHAPTNTPPASRGGCHDSGGGSHTPRWGGFTLGGEGAPPPQSAAPLAPTNTSPAPFTQPHTIIQREIGRGTEEGGGEGGKPLVTPVRQYSSAYVSIRQHTPALFPRAQATCDTEAVLDEVECSDTL